MKFSMDNLPPPALNQMSEEELKKAMGESVRRIFTSPQERGFYDKDFDHFNDDKGQ